ncbi:MAG TPA: hypothetical protein PLT37_00640, partial [Kiritimatiellia bacterium]|nr:hypothetical protein [Kiritimatiellia bacterium]HQG73663.1 hypothetical protein [Kiritimatiellia bacterium]
GILGVKVSSDSFRYPAPLIFKGNSFTTPRKRGRSFSIVGGLRGVNGEGLFEGYFLLDRVGALWLNARLC